MPRRRRLPWLISIVQGAVLGASIGCTPTGERVATDEVPSPVSDPGGSRLPPRELPDTVETSSAPVSLTSSDGTGLRLVSMKARAVVQQPLSLTELHLVFDNPENRQLEGRFTIDLPPDAALSRLAMKIGDQWQEGEVVERKRARQVYEEFLHKRRDPALLEKQAGNRFSARVFPIPALGRKEIIVSYSQEIARGDAPYRLPLSGLPELDELDVRVAVEPVDGGLPSVTAMRHQDYRPVFDLEVPVPSGEHPVAVRAGELAVARVRVTGPSDPDVGDGPLTILFDTSASRASGYATKIRRLKDLIRELRARRGDFPLRILAFDQATVSLFDGQASRFGDWVLARLYWRRPLGASDLGAALRRVAAEGRRGGRIVLMTDGLATLGARDTADLTEIVAGMRGRGPKRLDAIVDDVVRDDDALAALTAGPLDYAGVVIEGSRGTQTIVDALEHAVIDELPVRVEGATWSWPRTLHGVQPGDEVLVYARLPDRAVMSVVLEGEDPIGTRLRPREVDPPLVQRAVARAKIAALQQRLSATPADELDAREQWRKEIVALSTRHRVVSDHTALLVLETEADYDAYDIDRDALADILTIRQDEIAVRNRTAPVVAGAGGDPSAATATTAEPWPDDLPMQRNGFDPDMAQASGHFLASPYGAAFAIGGDDEDVWGGLSGTEIGEAFGTGGLGVVGSGRGGGGTGLIGRGGGGGTGAGRSASALRSGGYGFGGRGKPIPSVRLASPTVGRGLDKDIIRRIVRAHQNEIRYCYNQTLAARPAAKGRVKVQFTVGATGSVPTARTVEPGDLPRTLTRCIETAVRRWKFPRPTHGGSVEVTYPFSFEPGREYTPEEIAAMEARHAAEVAAMEARQAAIEAAEAEKRRTAASPYDGRRFDLQTTLQGAGLDAALTEAVAWVDEEPGNVVALVALGEMLAQKGYDHDAARAYGSLVDLFPSQVEMVRYAGARLSALREVDRGLVVDVLGHALHQRDDHPSGHRMLAYAQLRAGRYEDAFDTLLAASRRAWKEERFTRAHTILEEDMGIVAAAWLRAEPHDAIAIQVQLAAAGVRPTTYPSTRFVMSWETDANDVDFHIRDGEEGHAYYGRRDLPSGGTLFDDITDGYGPECFRIDGNANAYPYAFTAHYFSRGPMGYGMGTLQILQHDGEGRLAFDERPFLIMKDHANLDLGTLDGPLLAPIP